MTSKDYIAIAQAIRDARIYEQTTYSEDERAGVEHGITMAASGIAFALAEDNPRFDRAKFLAACGV